MLTSWTRHEPEQRALPYYNLAQELDEVCVALIIVSSLIGSAHLWRHRQTRYVHCIFFTFGMLAYAAHFGIALAELNGIDFGVLGTGFIMTATIQMLLRWAVALDKHQRQCSRYLVSGLVVCQVLLLGFAFTAFSFWLSRTFNPILFQIGYIGLFAVSILVLLIAIIQLVIAFKDTTEMRKPRQRYAILLCVITALQIGANTAMMLFFTPPVYAAELLLCIIAVVV
ncbi:hypothetical protein BDF22DRAFT_740029 [Syncephalis plumigaleata]|nr:hypothetical protein BDF22DRAFT_740029 [Syncephalis plumigaleata]